MVRQALQNSFPNDHLKHPVAVKRSHVFVARAIVGFWHKTTFLPQPIIEQKTFCVQSHTRFSILFAQIRTEPGCIVVQPYCPNINMPWKNRAFSWLSSIRVKLIEVEVNMFA